MTPLAEQRKALAGAVVTFLGAASNYLIAGGSVETVVEAAVVLAQSGIAALAGYLVVFWFSNRGKAPPATTTNA